MAEYNLASSKALIDAIVSGDTSRFKDTIVRLTPAVRGSGSKYLKQLWDHGTIAKGRYDYVANEIDVLLRRTNRSLAAQVSGSNKNGLLTRWLGPVSLKRTVTNLPDHLSWDAFVKASPGVNFDVMDRRILVGLRDNAALLGSIASGIETRYGVRLQITHFVRSSNNLRNPKSSHRIENGGFAADFQVAPATAFRLNDDVAEYFMQYLRAEGIRYNQFIHERSAKGFNLYHLDVKPTSRNANMVDDSGALGDKAVPHPRPATTSVIRSTQLEEVTIMRYVPVDVWANAMARECVALGIKDYTPSIARAFLYLEDELSRGRGTVDCALIGGAGGSYCGPLQFGISAWTDFGVKAGGLRFPSTSAMKKATRNLEQYGPGDISVMAKAHALMVRSYMRSLASRLRIDVSKLPVSAELAYALHNQGANGFAQYVLTGRKTNRQSSKAWAMNDKARADVLRVMNA